MTMTVMRTSPAKAPVTPGKIDPDKTKRKHSVTLTFSVYQFLPFAPMKNFCDHVFKLHEQIGIVLNLF